MHNKSIVLSSEQQKVLDTMLRGDNVALFGEAGSGKSLIVRRFLELTAINGNVVCLAPTGLAARNIGDAQTIHSFFRIDPGCVGVENYKPCPRLLAMLPYVHSIVIDEISMVRNDIFDIIENCLSLVPLRHKGQQAFGGRQIIVVGDFKQLPPVVDDENIEDFLYYTYSCEYAFRAKAWEAADFNSFFLAHSFRQNSQEYFNILRCVRNNHNLIDALNICNHRTVLDNLGRSQVDICLNNAMALCCRRREAAEINSYQMSLLPGYEYTFQAIINGVFPVNDLPTDALLTLKQGAKVMILANKKKQIASNFCDFEYVNGDIGEIVSIEADGATVQLPHNKRVKIQKAIWYNFEYDLLECNDGVKRIMAQQVGSFEQLPLAIAYASTIHKVQGQTLNAIYLRLGNGCFASGQLYTALSRIKNLESLLLDKPISIIDAIQDPIVDDFYNNKVWQ